VFFQYKKSIDCYYRRFDVNFSILIDILIVLFVILHIIIQNFYFVQLLMMSKKVLTGSPTAELYAKKAFKFRNLVLH